VEQALELPYLEQLHCPEDISFAGKNRETLEMIISDMMDPMMHGSDGIWHYMAKYLSDTMISPTHICFSLHFKHGNNKDHMFLDICETEFDCMAMVQIWEDRSDPRERTALDPCSRTSHRAQ